MILVMMTMKVVTRTETVVVTLALSENPKIPISVSLVSLHCTQKQLKRIYSLLYRLTPFPGFPGFLQKFMVYLLPLMVA